MRTTIKDIANYLNVSTTTVSRALNDKNDISDKMRQKVLEVAKLLDYKPNSIAISLRKKTSEKVIGVVLPSVNHHFFSTILRGITTTGYGDDYLIMIGESNHNVEREKEIINQFDDHYVAGVILVPTRKIESKENVDMIKRRKTPLILIDRTFENYQGSYIQHDDLRGSYDATNHLIEQGKREIAMLKGGHDCSLSQTRYEGYAKALRDNNLKEDNSLVISCVNANKEEGYNAAKQLFSLSSKPDAVFCITDRLAAGVLEYTKDHNISVPTELAIVGYSNSEISQNVTPKLTTVSQDGFEMGKLAKEYLIEICHHPDVVRQKVFSSKLIQRGST